ncbi:MAG TPA: hypothetical protein VJ790_05185 [Dongiaceae bacterium]|nr:hypothetical protein [Dongiaceae bacterium]
MLAAGLLLSACAGPSATIKADEFGDYDTATYLILSDQLQRVRNVRAREATGGSIQNPEARVCVGVLPQGRYGGIAPVPSHIVDRLQQDQSSAEVQLDVVSSYECLARYTRDDGPFTAEESDTLSYAAEEPQGQCGQWIGGTFGRETIHYDIEIDGGVARLTGGHRCVHQYWIRT